MPGRVITASWRKKDNSGWAGIGKHHLLRLMVTKASNRSAVHGARLPVKETYSKDEELKEEISKGKLKKEDKRKVVEKNVDSHINPADEAYSSVK